jgi:segregation and condensation protein B
MEDLKQIIESLLFITEEPLSIDRLKKVLQPVSGDDIRQALKQLAEDYENRKGGFTLKEVAGGFQFRTRPEYNVWVKKLIAPKPTRLSKAALETLAIIAYKQPIIRSEIEHIRGVDSGGVLRMLLEKNLTRVMGRKEIPGRPLIYGTTRHFLEVFELRNLKDLPTPKEIEEMGVAAGDPIDSDMESELPQREESISDILPEFGEPAPADHSNGGAHKGAAGTEDGAKREDEPPSSTGSSPPTESGEAIPEDDPPDAPEDERTG